MNDRPIGKVKHWYDKIMVAVLDLGAPLKVGERLRFRRGEEEFEETVSSMQIDHKNVTAAKKGEEVAIQISQRTKEGAEVFKL